MKNKIILSIALSITVFKHVIVLASGDNAMIGTWDSWDSLTAWPRLLIDRDVVFAPLGSLVPGFMGDIPRVSLGSELNVIVLLNVIFPPYTAHAFNTMLIALVGFAGMYLLLRDHVIREATLHWLVVAIATGFALFPFYPVAGISQSSIPLATHAIINIGKAGGKGRWQDWMSVCFIPFYSSFVFSYLFFLIIVFILAFRHVIVERSIPAFILPALVMIGLFMVVEYRFVHSLIAPSFTSHRVEFSSTSVGIVDMLKASAFVLLFGGNAPGVSAFVNHGIPLASLVVFIIWCWRSDKKAITRTIPWLLLIAGICLLHGAWNTAPVNALRGTFDLLNTFNFTRFTWLLTPTFFFLMGCSLKRVVHSKRKKRLATMLVASVACAQCAILIPFTHDMLVQSTRGGPWFTHASYFSTTTFNEVAVEIENLTGLQKQEYAVGSIGMEPIIAAANGFNTIDGYANNYPLEYKHRFRQVIAGELDKDETLREYFDAWGNRCYLFSSELGTAVRTRHDQASIANLAFNTTAMIELGCKFVFSTVEIENHAALGWTYLFTSDNEASAWIVRVYSIS